MGSKKYDMLAYTIVSQNNYCNYFYVNYFNVWVNYSNMLYYVVDQLRKLMKLLLVVEIVLRHRISLDW